MLTPRWFIRLNMYLKMNIIRLLKYWPSLLE